MLIRGWELSRLFENEAEGAGEGSSGAAAVVADSAPAVESSSAPDVTATTTGPLVSEDHATFEAYFDALEGKEPNKTSTDDVGDTPNSSEAMPNSASEDSVAAASGDDAGDDVVDVQRDALVVLAKAYAWTDEELKGFTGDQLKRLIAREEKRLAQPGGHPTETAPKAEATPPLQQEQKAADPFAEYVAKRTAQLENQGLSEEDIAIEIERDRLLFSGNQQLQQQLRQQEAAHAFERETQAFDAFLVAEMAPLFPDLIGTKPIRSEGPDTKAARNRVFEMYQALKRVRPGVSGEDLVRQAFNGVFAAQIQHRQAVTQAKRLQERTKQRMGSPSPTSPQRGVEWKGPTNQDPEIVSAFQRVQAERRQRVGAR